MMDRPCCFSACVEAAHDKEEQAVEHDSSLCGWRSHNLFNDMPIMTLKCPA